MVGLGVVSGVVSLVSFLGASSRASDAQAGVGDYGPSWQRYQDAVNFDRRMTGQQVCDLTERDEGNTTAATARDLCNAQRDAATLTLAFGIAGGVLAATGAVLLLIPSLSNRRATSSVRVSPMFGAHTGGAQLDLRF